VNRFDCELLYKIECIWRKCDIQQYRTRPTLTH